MENNQNENNVELSKLPDDMQEILFEYLEKLRKPNDLTGQPSNPPKYGVLSLLAKTEPVDNTKPANDDENLTIVIKLNDQGETASMKVNKAEFEKEALRMELLHMMIPVEGRFKKLTSDDVGNSISEMRKKSLSNPESDNNSTPKNK